MRITHTWLITVVLISSAQASAATDPATWNRNIERLDYYLSPPQGGDNGFFTTVANANDNTNVVLLYPANSSMAEFTQKLYRIRADLGGAAPTGCTNAYLNNLPYFMPTTVTPPPPAGTAALQGTYGSGKTYPDPAVYSNSAQSDGLNTARFYRYRNWPVNGGGTGETLLSACDGVAGGAGVASTACQVCVAAKGYWLNPAVANNDVSTNAGVFSPNWLRFHPAKWMLLSLAYKRLVNGPLLSPLREAVVATNGTVGGDVVQMMLPQSCSGNGRPLNQKLGAIDGLSYANPAKPLAELLFNTGWYMGGQDNPWVFANNNTQGNAPMAKGKSGPCNGCNSDFIILFSDGRGDTANPLCTQVAGVTPASCTAAAQCTTLGMGAEGDGDDFLDPGMANGAGAQVTGAAVRSTPGGTCSMDFADDVAGWMSTNNMSASGRLSQIKTYVIGIGDPFNSYGEMTILDQIAQRGGGRYLVADDFARLEANIELVFTAIRTRATSFSSTELTTVQTTGVSSAFVPRFKPALTGSWAGSLARYSLYNEFSAGCAPANYGVKSSVNPNGNASCTDFYLQDSNGKFVREDNNGNFGLVDTTQAYDAGWPLQVQADGGSIPAAPFWEANAKLTTRAQLIIGGTPPAEGARKIYTVAPSGAGYSPTLVPFSVANVANLTPLLLLGGLQGEFCTTLSSLSGTAYATENDCATDLIRFIHGEDVLRQNPLNRSAPPPSPLRARTNILGDIFHSSPILVVPPVPKFLCDLGFVNQCVPSLYSASLTTGGEAAYAAYYAANQYRAENVLVGANDGMLHSFNAGNDTVAGTTHSYDNGTGIETWAFIPPDLLPKLARYMLDETHQLLVDGTAMVRDVWVDGSGASVANGAKDSDEYHTVAIVGEREGGRGYLALDVTNPTTPVFLWSWPRPGTSQSLAVGFSWNDIGGAPPAIGPIAEFSATGTFTVNGLKATERYVVTFGGGYEPSLVRGRSIHFVDAWTGVEVYRFSRRDATGAAGDLRNNLYPVAAPVSMIDANSDGLFDTAVVGDVAGQVWTIGMGLPGKDTDSDGKYDNWFGARAFSEFKGDGVAKRSPFFHRAVTALFPSGELRVYLGSGDRDHIKAVNGGVCGPASLTACLRQDCSASVTETLYSVGPAPTGAGGHSISGGFSFTSGGTTITDTLAHDSVPQSSASTWVNNARTDYAFNCSANTAVSAPLQCDWGATDAGTDCISQAGLPLGSPNAAGTRATNASYFYSIKLFDTTNRLRFTTSAGATTYDTNRLTETNLVNAASATAAASGNGWYLTHAHSTDEKTAASALLFGGCILWSSLDPNANPTFSCGSPSPADTAWAFQADAITGAIACGLAGSPTASATVRSVSRLVTVTPQQASPVASVNPTTGQVSYSAVSMEAGGAPPIATTVGSSALSGTIHWLPVNRQLHECRHNGTNCQ